MAEIEREPHADAMTLPDLESVSARWARVSDAIWATVRTRIAEAQAAEAQAPGIDLTTVSNFDESDRRADLSRYPKALRRIS